MLDDQLLTWCKDVQIGIEIDTDDMPAVDLGALNLDRYKS